MSGVLKFQKEEPTCEDCAVVNSVFEDILNADDEEEVFSLVISLYEIGKEIGYKTALADGIEANARLLHELNGCGDCECELED
jgi:hypothetical protein